MPAKQAAMVDWSVIRDIVVVGLLVFVAVRELTPVDVVCSCPATAVQTALTPAAAPSGLEGAPSGAFVAPNTTLPQPPFILPMTNGTPPLPEGAAPLPPSENPPVPPQ